MSNLAKRIAEEVGDIPDEEVRELVLDECQCTQLTELTNKYINLEKLSAAGCGLETLKGLPSFPNLKRLDLSSNNLSGEELGYLKGCTSLTYLLLCGNPIKDLDSLLPLKEHKSLEKLDLTGCEGAEGDDYRDKVFGMLEQLVVLDGLDRDGTEVADDSDEEGDEDGDVDGSEDDDEEGVPDDFDEEEEDEDGEADGDDDDHERGVKRKHEDEEGDEDA